MYRAVLMLAAATVLAAPVASQQPRPGGPGQGPPLPEQWIPFDSLVQALSLTDDQRATVQPLHGTVDSIVRHGATVRRQMRDEMQRNPDREQAQRFFQRLQNMQQRVDRAALDLRAALTEEQKTALDRLRPPRVMPERPAGRRGN